MLNDNMDCVPCSTITGCERCENGKCHSCTGMKFPSLDQSKCMEPIINCADPIIPESYAHDEDSYQYYCASCNDGWYWNFDNWQC